MAYTYIAESEFDGSVYYYINTVTKNFADAEFFCMGKGGHLASIHSNEQMMFISILAQVGTHSS